MVLLNFAFVIIPKEILLIYVFLLDALLSFLRKKLPNNS